MTDHYEKVMQSAKSLCRSLKELEDACREASAALTKLRDAVPPEQGLIGDATIASAERVLTHGPDNHGPDADRER